MGTDGAAGHERQMLPQHLLGAGSSVGTALDGGLRAFASLPLGRGLSSPGSAGQPRVGEQLPGVWVPAARCQPAGAASLQTGAGSGSAGKRLPPIGSAAQLQLPEKPARLSYPSLFAGYGWLGACPCCNKLSGIYHEL